MDGGNPLDVVGDRATFRPRSGASLGQVAETISSVIARCRSEGIERLLVDITGLHELASPSMPQRYFAIELWAAAAAGRVKLALVARAETIDPQRFGVTVARNRGLQAGIFTSEVEAAAWLDGEQHG